MRDEGSRLLEKATRSVLSAARLREAGDFDFAIARAYYAMFYAAQALLGEKGLRFRKHGGVHVAFGEHFVTTGLVEAELHRWLLDAFDARVQADYGVDASLADTDASRVIDRARRFVQVARERLTSR